MVSELYHMGVSSSVDPGRPDPARHSIRTSFTLRVAVPAGCLALLWLLALAAALHLALAGRSLAGSHAILISYGLLALAGLAAIAAGAALTGSFERMIAKDLAALAAAAQQVAGLPAAARPGERQARRPTPPPWPRRRQPPRSPRPLRPSPPCGGGPPRRRRASPACATASGRSSSVSRSGTSRCCSGNFA